MRDKGRSVSPSSTNAVNAEADSTSGLADHGAVLERIVDTFDRVILHAYQEAAAQLWVGCTGVEQCG